MFYKTTMRLLLSAALLASAITAQADVFNMGGTISGGTRTGLASLSFVTVGDPGNVADTHWLRLGPVYLPDGHLRRDLAQYTAFLNAVAKTDTYGLYNSYMGNSPPIFASSRDRRGLAGLPAAAAEELETTHQFASRGGT